MSGGKCLRGTCPGGGGGGGFVLSPSWLNTILPCPSSLLLLALSPWLHIGADNTLYTGAHYVYIPSPV